MQLEWPESTWSLLVEVQTGIPSMEINVEAHQKARNQSTTRSGNTILYPKESTSYCRDTCSSMFITALFTIAVKWNQPSYLSADELIMKTWYRCTMEFYLAVKKANSVFQMGSITSQSKETWNSLARPGEMRQLHMAKGFKTKWNME